MHLRSLLFMNDKIYGSQTISDKHWIPGPYVPMMVVKNNDLQHDLETYGHDKSVDNGAAFYGEAPFTEELRNALDGFIAWCEQATDEEFSKAMIDAGFETYRHVKADIFNPI